MKVFASVLLLLAFVMPLTAQEASVEKIAFVTADEAAETNTIIIVNPDGTNAQPFLTSEGIYSPVWSPDGSQILFAANEAGGETMPDLDLWIVNADGSNLHPLNVGIYVTYQSPARGLLPADVVLPNEAIMLENALEHVRL